MIFRSEAASHTSENIRYGKHFSNFKFEQQRYLWAQSVIVVKGIKRLGEKPVGVLSKLIFFLHTLIFRAIFREISIMAVVTLVRPSTRRL